MMSKARGLNAHGFTITEVLVAAVIIAVSGLGLASAMQHLNFSRKKTQMISQTVALESSLISAIQDPNSYSSNAALLTAMSSGQNITDALQPTLQVSVYSNTQSTEISTPIVAGGAPIYYDKNNDVTTAAGDWMSSVTLSKLAKVQNLYAYNYQIKGNPAVASIPILGASTVTAPTSNAGSIPIPKESLQFASSAQTTSCTAANDLAMLGLGQDGNPICIRRAEGKCPSTSISKGFSLVLRGQSPLAYSYEFQCQPLRHLSCPTQVVDGGVDLTMNNPYALQSFVPNSLDESQGSAGVGTCVFLAASTGTPPTGLPATGDNGITITNACPPHYHVTPNPGGCQPAANDSAPASLSCVASVPADPSTAPPGGAVISYPDARSVRCQRQVTQVCCGDDHTRCASPWSGHVSLTYTCTLNSGVETVSAISTN
jgi:Tfp pilus assembly protein PilV